MLCCNMHSHHSDGAHAHIVTQPTSFPRKSCFSYRHFTAQQSPDNSVFGAIQASSTNNFLHLMSVELELKLRLLSSLYPFSRLWQSDVGRQSSTVTNFVSQPKGLAQNNHISYPILKLYHLLQKRTSQFEHSQTVAEIFLSPNFYFKVERAGFIPSPNPLLLQYSCSMTLYQRSKMLGAVHLQVSSIKTISFRGQN